MAVNCLSNIIWRHMVKFLGNQNISIWVLIVKYIFLKKILNTASVQDSANSHTNQIRDFEAPMYFRRVLPPSPNHRQHGMGFGRWRLMAKSQTLDKKLCSTQLYKI